MWWQLFILCGCLAEFVSQCVTTANGCSSTEPCNWTLVIVPVSMHGSVIQLLLKSSHNLYQRWWFADFQLDHNGQITVRSHNNSKVATSRLMSTTMALVFVQMRYPLSPRLMVLNVPIDFPGQDFVQPLCRTFYHIPVWLVFIHAGEEWISVTLSGCVSWTWIFWFQPSLRVHMRVQKSSFGQTEKKNCL